MAKQHRRESWDKQAKLLTRIDCHFWSTIDSPQLIGLIVRHYVMISISIIALGYVLRKIDCSAT